MKKVLSLRAAKTGVPGVFTATRANFLPASVIPFLTGAALAFKEGFVISKGRFLFGIIGVISAHLAGNLFNDYFDCKSGADGIAVKRSPFFGGSGVIQDGRLGPQQVLRMALSFAGLSFICGASITFITLDPLFPLIMAAAAFLAFEYTAPPLRLAYNRLGELDIFILFGAGLVMCSFYLFTGGFSFDSFLVSLPISFLITSVIVANEVPDAGSDIKAGKDNLVSSFGGGKGYVLYGACVVASFLSILLNIAAGNLPRLSIAVLPLYLLGARTARILKDGTDDPARLTSSSGMAVALHATAGIAVVALLFI